MISRAWQLKQDEHQVVWLHLDCPNRSLNTLSRSVLTELEALLAEVEEIAPKGVVLLSDKPKGFVAGADVEEFTTIKTTEEAAQWMASARALFERIERLPMPTVALIHGHCLGGGLELALSCDYRVIEEGGKIGFPEVNLGIFPGFGGTVRSIRRVGVMAAMKLMISGRPIHAGSAQRSGWVDQIVAERHLRHAALQWIEGGASRRRIEPPWWNRVLEWRGMRWIVAALLRREVEKRVVVEHYPAPFALIELWRRYGGNTAQMYRQEGRTVAELLSGTVAQQLIRLFFLQNRMKSFGRGEGERFVHIHVVGAGVMGGDIAAWCALKGMRVTLQDRSLETIAGAVARAGKLLAGKLHGKRMQQAAMDRLIPDLHGDGVARADLVLEVIVEDLLIKQALFRQIEAKLRPDAVLATNTSSIPLEQLAQGLENPQRLVGIHFFNPVAKMKLVEVVSGEQTDPAVAARAATLVHQIGRLPLPVRSAPGFLINRILMPYLMESVRMVEEGVPPEKVDQVARWFGMPMGPIELADRVGLDICVAVGHELAGVSGDVVPKRLERWVEAGRLGVKSGQGFYRYRHGKPVHDKELLNAPIDSKLIEDRMILRMVNEAVRCLREGVVEDGDLLDAGMVFGTGFAPFRGGVTPYIEARGHAEIQQRLDTLEQSVGSRFSKDAGWEQV